MAKSIKRVSFLTDEDKKVLELCKEHNLSVSSVKYSRGHDCDSMECNLKVGSKIVGTAWDDSWGGGNQYNDKSATVSVEPFMKGLEAVKKEAPTYKAYDMVMSYCDDSIVGLLVEQAELEKKCKKKTIVIATLVDSENARKDEFAYPMAYNNSEAQINHIENDMANDNYVTYEIVNQRFL